MIAFLVVLAIIAIVVTVIMKKLHNMERPRARSIEQKERSRSRPRARYVGNKSSRGAGGNSRSSFSMNNLFSTSSKVKTGKASRTSAVKRREIPYWKRRGWKEDRGNLTGYYRTKYGTYKGKITKYRRRSPGVFIYNPPTALQNHPHYHCFFHKGHGKYFVHFKRNISDPSIAIQSVETILRESFTKYKE